MENGDSLYARIAKLEKQLHFFESMPHLSNHTQDLICGGYMWEDGAWKREGWVFNEDEDEWEKDTYGNCEWCAAKIKPSDYNMFHCMNNDCDKVVCGRRGCSQQLSYYVCCEECEDSAHSSTYEDERQLWRDFYKTTDKVCEGFTKKKQPCKNKVSSGKFCCLHC